MNYIISFILLVALVTCKNKQPASSSNGSEHVSVGMQDPPPTDTVTPPKPIQASPNEQNTDTVVNLQGNDGNMRLVVLFYSIGEGSEFNLIKEFENSIKNYAASIGKEIDFRKQSWGREGETDFCLPLTELNVSQQVDFVTKSKSLLQKGKWVNIYENYPCPKRRIR